MTFLAKNCIYMGSRSSGEMLMVAHPNRSRVHTTVAKPSERSTVPSKPFRAPRATLMGVPLARRPGMNSTGRSAWKSMNCSCSIWCSGMMAKG